MQKASDIEKSSEKKRPHPAYPDRERFWSRRDSNTKLHTHSGMLLGGLCRGKRGKMTCQMMPFFNDGLLVWWRNEEVVLWEKIFVLRENTQKCMFR